MSQQQISLKDFFLTGSFGGVEMWADKKEVLQKLGAPDDIYIYGTDYFYLVYGYLQFGFRNNCLFEIVCDLGYLSNEGIVASAGENIALESWIVWNGLDLAEAEAALIKESIWYRKIEIPKNLTLESDAVVELMSAAGVRFVFRGFLNWQMEKMFLNNSFDVQTPLSEFIDYYTY